jgi:predicted transcriptional regulator
MSTTAASAKEQMIRLISEQPDDSSYDELLRELAFARMVDRGLADSDAGRTVTHEEMKQTIDTWQK